MDDVSFNRLDFTQLHARGGLPGGRDRFERLITQLVRLDEPTGRQIEVSRHKAGDGGLDVIAGHQGDAVRIWQAKFPDPPKLGSSQRDQVRSSLKTAIATIGLAGGSIEQWTLAVPFDLDGEEDKWFSQLIKNNPGLGISLMGRAAIEARLNRPDARGIRTAYFDLRDEDVGYRTDPTTSIREADPLALGVAPASGNDPVPSFVKRDVDVELDSRFGASSPVGALLVGESGAGKSRAAYEALLRCQPNAQVLAPDPSRDVRVLYARVESLRDPENRRHVVLWLDDLSAFLRPEALSIDDLTRLIEAPDITVVATMRSAQFNDRLLKDRVDSRALTLFGEPIFVERRPSLQEKADFVRLHDPPDPDRGIGLHFLAAERLKRKYVNAAPLARRIIDLAVDWQRTTGDRPVSTATLRALSERVYGADQEFDTALAWASSDPGPDALLDRRGEGLWRAKDLLVGSADETPIRPIGPATWRAMVEEATPTEAAAIASAALDHGKRGEAEFAIERARLSTSSGVLATAMLQLGRLYEATNPEESVNCFIEGLTIDDAELRLATVERIVSIVAVNDLELDRASVERIDETLLPLSDRDSVLLLRGRAASYSEDALEALQELESDAQSRQSRPIGQLMALVGVELHKAGYVDDARNRLVEADELGALDDNGQAAALLAQIRLGQGDLDAALPLFERASALDDASNFSHVDELVEAFDDAGRADELRPFLLRLAGGGNRDARQELKWREETENAGPEVASAHVEQAQEALRDGNWELAVYHADEAEKLNSPKAAELQRDAAVGVLIEQAHECEESGDLPGAIDAWEEGEVIGIERAGSEIARLRRLI